MSWIAQTDHPAVETGTSIRIDRGTSDSAPRNGETIDITHGTTGRVTALVVVSSAPDRLEVTDGRRNLVLKPHAVTKPNVLDADGHYRDAWIVV